MSDEWEGYPGGEGQGMHARLGHTEEAGKGRALEQLERAQKQKKRESGCKTRVATEALAVDVGLLL